MAVSVDAVPVTAPSAGPARPAAPRRTRRRDLLRGLLGASAALAIVPVVTATRPRTRADGGPADTSFEETYRGRRILGLLTTAGAAGTGHAEWTVTVDGRPLHLMRRADGTWMSMVDHYRSYTTPLEAARAAVDELGPGQRLREAGPAHHDDTHMGGHHGLHP
ncbi:tyrosinase family oxidase copper chaperone [Streptomyces sp. NPDC054884]|uniref:tyrosinase family oxidase copper chaperone n=1 Tax=Streptomyces sp. ME08-AFT2 TaxID=3028683 RepID=UPI0029B21D2A|nr:tyrosinase family oxidase copper chaperone [Streptomyces sp. ME08-AFT2]MDX3314799.1 tyrosinase family oxidase copper chaperone [Streptomyces sp. ME08-AFT2]